MSEDVLSVSHRSDISYLAGIIDGEGCLRIIKRSSGGWDVDLSVTSTCRVMLEHIQKSFGGTIARENRGGDNEQAYRWHIAAKPTLLNLLPILIPELVIKKMNAILLLDFCQRFSPGKGMKFFPGEKILMDKYANLSSILNSVGRGSAELKQCVVTAIAGAKNG